MNQLVNQSISQLASESVPQCLCFDILDSQQPLSPIVFPLLETSATALCGTTGRNFLTYKYLYHKNKICITNKSHHHQKMD